MPSSPDGPRDCRRSSNEWGILRRRGARSGEIGCSPQCCPSSSAASSAPDGTHLRHKKEWVSVSEWLLATQTRQRLPCRKPKSKAHTFVNVQRPKRLLAFSISEVVAGLHAPKIKPVLVCRLNAVVPPGERHRPSTHISSHTDNSRIRCTQNKPKLKILLSTILNATGTRHEGNNVWPSGWAAGHEARAGLGWARTTACHSFEARLAARLPLPPHFAPRWGRSASPS